MFDFEEDSKETTITELTNIKNLAQLQLSLQAKVELAEETLDDLKSQLANIQTRELPQAMKAAGVKDFTLEDGSKIVVKNEVKASIPKGCLGEALTWLAENGGEPLIKNKVVVAFKMKQNDDAERLVEELQERGLSVTIDKSVHSGSLTSFVKEQIDEQKEIPRDLLGVFTYDKAVIKN